jgi:hypothetical protein
MVRSDIRACSNSAIEPRIWKKHPTQGGGGVDALIEEHQVDLVLLQGWVLYLLPTGTPQPGTSHIPSGTGAVRMKDSQVARIKAAAEPMIKPEEQIELCAAALIGTVSTARKMRDALVVSALTAGTITAFRTPRKYYLALTDRRLLFIGIDPRNNKPGKLVFDLPREVLTTGKVQTKRAMLFVKTLRVELEVVGVEKNLILTFPTVCLNEGQQLADLFTARAKP